ncbi:MAG: diaminopimelate decarboxylase [Oscillospiraceae bacterium]|nr:diaminopimelate decarboxylase [Oscillospiraceae bacterium]
MNKLNNFSEITAAHILHAAAQFGTPLYLYDERLIAQKCAALTAMPNAFGITVRYAMKANSNRTLLKIIASHGLLFDASSLNEARRAHLAGASYKDIILTTQEFPDGDDLADLKRMMLAGMKYNACSLSQLYNIGTFAAENEIKLAVRVHPGTGSGESATRNTGDEYSCFGIHLSDIPAATAYADRLGIILDHVHVHIGSGASPEAWRSNIDLELEILEKHFPKAAVISFGGGLKEARMPDEKPADIQMLGEYAKAKIADFHKRIGRKLHMEIEPGTYVAANAGYAVTRVIDKKKNGGGLNFIILDGGMEINTRPLLYGSRHPFYVISKNGALLSSEFTETAGDNLYEAVIVGKCCEAGDSQCLDADEVNIPRKMAQPERGDIVVIGGTGAYCSSMSPMNYNSHTQVPEVLLTADGSLRLIRKRQTLEQMLENEM